MADVERAQLGAVTGGEEVAALELGELLAAQPGVAEDENDGQVPRAERALTPPERAEVLEVLASERFVDVAPEEVWATLLDEGTYLCSTRTMYRILADEYGEVRDRRNQLTHPPYTAPELLATAPNELWSWDMSRS